MTRITYPALYDAASAASAGAQRRYLWLLRLEYASLIIAAIFSLDFSHAREYFVGYALVFVLSLAILLLRSVTNPEQEWYKARALAESVKTMTWRYCMRAAPFSDAPHVGSARREFRQQLRGILESNRSIGERIPPKSAANDQVSSQMQETRASSLHERKLLYLNMRILDQREWYKQKAIRNRNARRIWIAIGILVYFAAIISVLIRIDFNLAKVWPTEPLIAVASSILGWVQIKKFSELSAAYTLTAHEIGILQGQLNEIESEVDFSDFVNEAELAFSREHTQWMARQQVH